MQSESIARKVHKQTKPAPRLRLPFGQPLPGLELKNLRKFLAAAKAMEMDLAEIGLVSDIRQRIRKGECVSLSGEESQAIDWIITRHHYELPLETIVCSTAQIEDLWKFTECIGEGYLGSGTAHFVNWIRQKVRLFRHDVIWLTPRESETIEEIKLRFRPRGAWTVPIDPDGVEEYDGQGTIEGYNDPEAGPVAREEDQFDLRAWRSIDWFDRSQPLDH